MIPYFIQVVRCGTGQAMLKCKAWQPHPPVHAASLIKLHLSSKSLGTKVSTWWPFAAFALIESSHNARNGARRLNTVATNSPGGGGGGGGGEGGNHLK